MMKDICPRCKEEFDSKEYELIECVVCGEELSTKCCLPGGMGTMCDSCEELDDD